eukprot:3452635-Pyramimonas_sp.AAC.1
MARGSSSTTTTAARTTPLTTPSTAPRLQEATASARATSSPSAQASPPTSTTSEGAARDAPVDEHSLATSAGDCGCIRGAFVSRAISGNQLFIASSWELAEDLSSYGAGLISPRKFSTTSLDTDAHASRKRAMTTASETVKFAFRRAYKLQKPCAGAKVGGIQRAGPLATA